MATIDLRLRTGEVLSYDPESEQVLLNGRTTTRYKATFIPDAEGTPQLFGFVSTAGVCYDIYGNQSRVVEEDKIKL